VKYFPQGITAGEKKKKLFKIKGDSFSSSKPMDFPPLLLFAPSTGV